MYATPKKGVGSSGEGGIVDLKCRKVCRIFVKKRRSGRIDAKEIYGGRGGGVRQNQIWGIGAVDAKMQGGICQRRSKEKLQEGGVVEVKKKHGRGV